MKHYFSPNPSALHDLRTTELTVRGVSMSFVTDSGVFSKGILDYGSRLLMENMQIPPQSAVLDLGCGWGAIGILAALINPSGHVTMVDVNERALVLAARNAQENQVTNATVLASDGFAGLLGFTYDVVLTNPPIRAGKEVVFSFYEGAKAALRPGGKLWVVIRKKQGADSTEKKLSELFYRVELMARSKGYHVYAAEHQPPFEAKKQTG